MSAGAGCLECHSKPAVAPAAMVTNYGPKTDSAGS